MAQLIQFPLSSLRAEPVKKSKKRRRNSQPGQLLGQRLVTAGLVSEDQLAFALLRQATSGERLGRIFVEAGLISPRSLTDHLSVGDARAAAVIELETLFQHRLAELASKHSRNFLVFVLLCVAALVACCVAGDMIPISAFVCAAAAMAGIYHQLQRRHYDMHAFATRARVSLLNSLKNCDSVTAVEAVMSQSLKFFHRSKGIGSVPVSPGTCSSVVKLAEDDETELEQ